MTLYEFRMLNDDHQLKSVCDKGIFLENQLESRLFIGETTNSALPLRN